MTRPTGLDCAVMYNLINTHIQVTSQYLYKYLPTGVLPPADEGAVFSGQHAVRVSQQPTQGLAAAGALDNHHVLVLR